MGPRPASTHGFIEWSLLQNAKQLKWIQATTSWSTPCVSCRCTLASHALPTLFHWTCSPIAMMQIAAYMNEVRQNRLERVANKQDDEVVGIVGLYLSITMVILALAALANLPV